MFTKYGKINQRQTAENYERMKTSYYTAKPIETLFAQIGNGIEMAMDAENPFSVQQVLTRLYNIIQKTGVYTKDLREWMRNILAPLKNWSTFKTHFAASHRDFME